MTWCHHHLCRYLKAVISLVDAYSKSAIVGSFGFVWNGEMLRSGGGRSQHAFGSSLYERLVCRRACVALLELLWTLKPFRLRDFFVTVFLQALSCCRQRLLSPTVSHGRIFYCAYEAIEMPWNFKILHLRGLFATIFLQLSVVAVPNPRVAFLKLFVSALL